MKYKIRKSWLQSEQLRQYASVLLTLGCSWYPTLSRFSFVQDFTCTHFSWTALTQAPRLLQIQGPCGPIFTLPSPPPVPPSLIGYHLPNAPFLNPLVPPRYVMPRPATPASGNVVNEVFHSLCVLGKGQLVCVVMQYGLEANTHK